MSERKDRRTLAGVLGDILIAVAMMLAIALCVREGFTLLIPPDSCAGTPTDGIIFTLSFVFMYQTASSGNRRGYARHLRLGATLLAGLMLAVPVARLAAGCALPGAWGDEARFAAEALVMFGVLIPLGHLHRDVIEPRWSRAMGEDGGPAEEEGPQA